MSTTNPSVITDRVLQEVLAERIRQDERWGVQSHPDGTGMNYQRHLAEEERAACEAAFRSGRGTWRHVMAEEIAEANAEKDPAKLRAELLQVAAVAAGRRRRLGGRPASRSPRPARKRRWWRACWPTAATSSSTARM